MKSTINIMPSVLIAGAIVLLALVLSLQHTTPVFGSTSKGSEYQGTTTVSNVFPQEAVLQTAPGTLGSVVVTGAAAGVINIYDATTSSILARATSMSTSSILLATIPASAAAGTYIFDRVAVNGVYVSIIGTTPTTTITFRQ